MINTKILIVSFCLAASSQVFADFSSDCVNLYPGEPSAAWIDRCNNIKNEFSLRCVSASRYGSFFEVDSCAKIETDLAAKCTETFSPTADATKIESCVYVKTQAAVDCINRNSDAIEIRQCSSL